MLLNNNMTSEEAENMENTNRNNTTYLDTRNEINHEIVLPIIDSSTRPSSVNTGLVLANNRNNQNIDDLQVSNLINQSNYFWINSKTMHSSMKFYLYKRPGSQLLYFHL
jgi:hypothetical protein